MLLHIILRPYVAEPDTLQCELTNFRCPDFGVKLWNDIKMGRKAVRGVLIETTQRMCQFTMLTCWAVGTDYIVNHQVQYFVIDDELNAITGNMVLWSGMPPSLDGFNVHWPLPVKKWTPAVAQSHMELASRERVGHYADRIDSVGRILERCEVFQVSTVERERVLYSSKPDIYAHTPTADMAFTASV